VYGRALGEAGQLGRGIEQLERAAAGAAEVFGPSSLLAGIFAQNLVGLQLEYGQIERALANSDKGFEIIASHSEQSSYNYAGALYSRGAALLAARRAPQADAALSRALEIFKTVLGPTHSQTFKAQTNRALALGYVGKSTEGLQEILPIVTSQRTSGDAALNRTLHVEGVLHRLAGENAAALKLQQESLALSEANPRGKLDQARALTESGWNHLELGQPEAAATLFEKALALFRETQPQVTPQRADALVGLGRARLARNQPADARPTLQEGDAFWREFDAGNRWAGEAALWLGRSELALGHRAEANDALNRAVTILSQSEIPSDTRLVKLARERG
jgi:tetratricopeptide (TPR) repeat protein